MESAAQERQEYLNQQIETAVDTYAMLISRSKELDNSGLFPKSGYHFTPLGLGLERYLEAGLDVEGRINMIKNLIDTGEIEKAKQILRKTAKDSKWIKSEESIIKKEAKVEGFKNIEDYTRGTFIRFEPYIDQQSIIDDVFKIEEFFGDKFVLVELDPKLKAGGYSDCTLKFGMIGSKDKVFEIQLNTADCIKLKEQETPNYEKKKDVVNSMLKKFQAELQGVEFSTKEWMDCMNIKSRYDVKCKFASSESFGVGQSVYDNFLLILDSLGFLDQDGTLNQNVPLISEFITLFKNGLSIYEEASPMVKSEQTRSDLVEMYQTQKASRLQKKLIQMRGSLNNRRI